MTIPLRDGPTTTELSEAALLLALGAILTREQIGAWLTTAVQVQAKMDAETERLGFQMHRVLRPERNGLVEP
jgi:hypothetical protein